jgi:hypothetical protein
MQDSPIQALVAPLRPRGRIGDSSVALPFQGPGSRAAIGIQPRRCSALALRRGWQTRNQHDAAELTHPGVSGAARASRPVGKTRSADQPFRGPGVRAATGSQQ